MLILTLLLILILICSKVKFYVTKQFLMLLVASILSIASLIISLKLKKYIDFDYTIIVTGVVGNILSYLISEYVDKSIENYRYYLSFYFIDKEVFKTKRFCSGQDVCTSILYKDTGYLNVYYYIKTDDNKDVNLKDYCLTIKIDGISGFTFQKAETDSMYQDINDNATELSMNLSDLGTNSERMGCFSLVLNESDVSAIDLKVSISYCGKNDTDKNRVKLHSNYQKISIE